MVTYFCPNCWNKVDGKDAVCSHCGFSLTEYSNLSYEKSLILSLHSPIMNNRMIAIQILGELRSQEALPGFKEILETENDFYSLREVLYALSKFDCPESEAMISAATKHPSKLVREFAERMLSKRQRNKEI